MWLHSYPSVELTPHLWVPQRISYEMIGHNMEEEIEMIIRTNHHPRLFLKKANQPVSAVRLTPYKTHKLVARLSGLVILWHPPWGLYSRVFSFHQAAFPLCAITIAGRRIASLNGGTPRVAPLP